MPKKRHWNRSRPDSNEEMETALREEKRNQARWYQCMSGQAKWDTGEREAIHEQWKRINANIHRIIGEDAARKFAELPEEP